MYKILLISTIISFLCLNANGNDDYYTKQILNKYHVTLIDSIENDFLKLTLREFILSLSDNSIDILSIALPYAAVLNDEIRERTLSENEKYRLIEAGYRIPDMGNMIKDDDYIGLINFFPDEIETMEIILNNASLIDRTLLYEYAIGRADKKLNMKLYIDLNDSMFIYLQGFIDKKDDIAEIFIHNHSELLYLFNREYRLYAGSFLADSVDDGMLAYYRGRYYESKNMYSEAMILYNKADDEEAYIRMIANIGNRMGRSISDSILLNNDKQYLSVLYHRAKAYYSLGENQIADSIIEYLTDINDINYYTVRALFISKKNVFSQCYYKSESNYYKKLFDVFDECGKRELFYRFTDMVYESNHKYAKYFAVMFRELGIHQRSLLYGYRMKAAGFPINECIEFLFPAPYLTLFSAAAEKYNIDIALLYAIARQESWFNPSAQSPVGAKGIMQLMDFVYDEYYKDEDYFNIEKNIDAGANHIKNYLGLFEENPAYGIMSYNAGPGNVVKWERKNIDWELYLEMIPFRETRIFVKNILRDYYFYRLRFNES